MRYLFTAFLILSSLYSNEYEFSVDEFETIETKPYEYSGYIKGDYKYQVLNKQSQETYLGEAFFNYKHFYNQYTLHLDIMANYENIDNDEEDKAILNQGFINYKYDDNHQLYIGKKTPKWGKGYYFNPVAFIDRKKDPNNPEASREGFTQINYKYNKVLKGDLQNIAFDIVYLKTTENLNSDLYNEDSNIAALKTYLLYRDIDLDFIYIYSDKQTDKWGVDLSANLKTNFEIHGEYGRFDNGYYSYLAGLKYLTQNDLTILSEYYYQNEKQANNTPFSYRRYLINSLNQKEPLDMLYFSLYFKNTYNLEDDSYQNKLGCIYTGMKNVDLDFSISKNMGESSSEFGNKLIDRFVWVSLKYSF
jgi:hypothetical protein